MFQRPCFVKIGDLVRSRENLDLLGFVTYVDKVPDSNDYYVEVVFDDDADPLYFYDDQLEVLRMIKE
jgi:hypothetical protein